ncbi:MAG: hypothetical protein WC717_02200 [Candidatus Micrarchaeia archaeon]
MVGKTRFSAIFVVMLLLSGLALAYAGTFRLDSRSSGASRNTSTGAAIDSAVTTIIAPIAAALPAEPCNDTDGGHNYGVKGSAWGCYTDASGKQECKTYEDKCILPDYAEEVSCENGLVKLGDYSCSKGSKCYDGVCHACAETDGGFNPNKLGSASGVNNISKKYATSWDGCIGTKVREVYCGEDGYVYHADTSCQMGYACKDGACAPTGGATCAAAGESCDGAVCCSPLACKQYGSQYLCSNSTMTSTATAAKKQVNAPSATQLNATEVEIPEDEAIGTAHLKEMLWFAYGMDNETMPYYVEMSLDPQPKMDTDSPWGFPEYSDAWGNVDGISFFMKKLGNLEIRFADGAHALAFYRAIAESTGKAKVHYTSHDCDYQSYVDKVFCSVGTDPRDGYKLVEELN